MPLPKIQGNKRIALGGKTRTGKSTMARYLLEAKAKEGWWIVIIDPKDGWMIRDEGRSRLPYGTLGNFKDPVTSYEYKDFAGSIEYPIYSNVFIPECKVILYNPVQWDSLLDDMIDIAMEHKYVIFYFDEVGQLATSSKIPLKLNVLYTQGAAKLCGAWAGFQRPVGIPENLKSQAEIWIMFFTNKYEDRVKIADYIPKNKYLDWFVSYELPYYYYLYYDDRMTGPIILPPLSLGLKSERMGSIVQFPNRRTG